MHNYSITTCRLNYTSYSTCSVPTDHDLVAYYQLTLFTQGSRCDKGHIGNHTYHIRPSPSMFFTLRAESAQNFPKLGCIYQYAVSVLSNNHTGFRMLIVNLLRMTLYNLHAFPTMLYVVCACSLLRVFHRDLCAKSIRKLNVMKAPRVLMPRWRH